MCGIAGFVDSESALGADELARIAERMAETLEHRGPDDSGVWTDERTGVALAHRRLAVIDLSVSGHQPMSSECGRYVLVFNGEIYNHRSLRGELESKGVRFRGHSDTEVLVESVAEWGLERTLPKLNGMFAFALWDARHRRLWLARDRLGEKPLYYGRQGHVFFFASELSAIGPHPSFEARVDRQAVASYMRHKCVPTPLSIYEGIGKLPPGTFLSLDAPTLRLGSPEQYWSVWDAAAQGSASQVSAEPGAVVDELAEVVDDAVSSRMEADVPLGAFLSGGIDSSLVVAFMQQHSTRPVRTFSIGFRERAYDEAPFARAVSEHLGTDHTELYLTPEEALAVVPRLSTLYDEPFADSSQIPTFLVSRLAREQVTVSLSGDGGDELFGGYALYGVALAIDRWTSRVPRSVRQLAPFLARGVPRRASDLLLGAWSSSKPERAAPPSDRLMKLGDVLDYGSRLDMYDALLAAWLEPSQLVLGLRESPSGSTTDVSPEELPDFLSAMMYTDATSYLPDDILTKLDRASMGVSLEARVPLLDHRLVEFAWRIPSDLRLRDGRSKWILRQLAQRYVPAELLDRPKTGFSIPIAQWLRGPLREWAEELIAQRRLEREGFLSPAAVRQKWDEHISGRRDWKHALWSVLMFQTWLEENGGQG